MTHQNFEKTHCKMGWKLTRTLRGDYEWHDTNTTQAGETIELKIRRSSEELSLHLHQGRLNSTRRRFSLIDVTIVNCSRQTQTADPVSATKNDTDWMDIPGSRCAQSREFWHFIWTLRLEVSTRSYSRLWWENLAVKMHLKFQVFAQYGSISLPHQRGKQITIKFQVEAWNFSLYNMKLFFFFYFCRSSNARLYPLALSNIFGTAAIAIRWFMSVRRQQWGCVAISVAWIV